MAPSRPDLVSNVDPGLFGLIGVCGANLVLERLAAIAVVPVPRRQSHNFRIRAAE